MSRRQPNADLWRPLIKLTEAITMLDLAGPDGRHDAALGEIGVISSVTKPFCGDCTRARISAEGKAFLGI